MFGTESSISATRYSRNMLLQEVGPRGQKAFNDARVLVIGAGGLGSPVLMYLAAAGIGHIGIVDDDFVELSNLQRQIIHTEATVGMNKAVSARETLKRMNSGISVHSMQYRINSTNVFETLRGYDVVVDGTDNFATRYLLSDACEITDLPYVWGSVLRFEGQVGVSWVSRGPTYRDLYPEVPSPSLAPGCAQAGILGSVCATIGSLIATQVLMIVGNFGDPLLGRYLTFDALSGNFESFEVLRDPKNSPLTSLRDYEALCESSTAESAEESITVEELDQLLKLRERGDRNFTLIDVRERFEREICIIPGATSIPLGELLDEVHGWQTETPIIVHCKSDARSRQASKQLRSAGFSDVKFVNSGILGWIKKIDSAQPLY